MFAVPGVFLDGSICGVFCTSFLWSSLYTILLAIIGVSILFANSVAATRVEIALKEVFAALNALLLSLIELNNLFEMQAGEKEFQDLDNTLIKESNKLLNAFVNQISPQDYEQIRDVVFSIAYLAKKSAFEIGFKTAVNLVMECKKE